MKRAVIMKAAMIVSTLALAAPGAFAQNGERRQHGPPDYGPWAGRMQGQQFRETPGTFQRQGRAGQYGQRWQGAYGQPYARRFEQPRQCPGYECRPGPGGNRAFAPQQRHMQQRFQAGRRQDGRNERFGQRPPQQRQQPFGGELRQRLERLHGKMLERFDKNGDGRLSDDEKTLMRREFEKWLDQKDDQRPLQQRGPRPPRKDAPEAKSAE